MTSSTQPPSIDIKNIEEVPAIVTKQPDDLLITTLRQECRIYTQYLAYQEPVEYVWEKYYQAHLVNDELAHHTVSQFEDLLLRISRIHPLFTRAADIYTSFILKDSILRKKIILLLAILESCAPSYEFLDQPDQIGLFGLITRGVLFGLAYLVSAIISLVLLTPVHLAVAASSALSRKAVQA